MNILDVLLDEDDFDSIMLMDEEGSHYQFEQVAVFPYNHKIYCILKPIDPMENIKDDEAIVFYVDEAEDPVLKLETDEYTSLKVFEQYYEMLEEQ